jgi:hypothetical protein
MIPTAEEFLERIIELEYDDVKTTMIEFAKLHVEAALKATAIMGKETWDWTTEECNSITEDAYPLDQIK